MDSENFLVDNEGKDLELSLNVALIDIRTMFYAYLGSSVIRVWISIFNHTLFFSSHLLGLILDYFVKI